MLVKEKLSTEGIAAAEKVLRKYMGKTPLTYSDRLSKKYNSKIYLKREDTQIVRSYKIRGALYNILSTEKHLTAKGIVCASAGNHAQGVAFACSSLQLNADIFMPLTTPNQKVERVKHFGKGYLNIHLVGETYDEAESAAYDFAEKKHKHFVHAYDQLYTIMGQGTVAKEVLDELPQTDVFVAPVGGGGLLAGCSFYLKSKNKDLIVIAAEPSGAPKLSTALADGKPVKLPSISKFVDGAAVNKIGINTFGYIKSNTDHVCVVNEGDVCTAMIELYQNEGIITEPAAALSIAALEKCKEYIENKTVVCVVSGGNNDISRYSEILERSLIQKGLRHYFVVEFAQRPGHLKQFVNDVLGSSDDIFRFEYLKKNNREYGPALVGVEIKEQNDYKKLKTNLEKNKFSYYELKQNDLLWRHLV